MRQSAIADKTRQAGVIGAGGAGFPTHVKLSNSCQIVIANGAECEPLLQCDQQVMFHYGREMVRGLELAVKATGASEGIIALKKKHENVIPVLDQLIASSHFNLRLFQLGNHYPAGDEQVLVYEVSGRIVPEGGRPGDVGCLVFNVQTLKQIAEAQDGIPVTDRIVSVHGQVADPLTVRVPIGTPVREVADACGGLEDEHPFVLSGGVMMGLPVTLEDGVSRTTSGLYFLPQSHPLARLKREPIESALNVARFACEQCSFCTLLCPRYLLGHDLYPSRIMQAVGWNAPVSSEIITGAYLCCECGLCGVLFACPLLLSPDRFNGELKKKLGAGGVPNPHKKTIERVREDRDSRLISVELLIRRLSLCEYDLPSPYEPARLAPARVRVPLNDHIGSPAVPVVHLGQAVELGETIAETPAGSLGTTVHASISGAVTGIAEDVIQISAKDSL